MKILTKNWVEKYEQVKLAHLLKEVDRQKTFNAKELLVTLEKEAEEANRLTKIAEDCLLNEFTLDDVVGELVKKEYSNGKDYFINVGDYYICIENYSVIEREAFKIDNTLNVRTSIETGELHYISDKLYELHLLFKEYNEEKKLYWYFTLRGSNVKFVKHSD